MTNLKQTKQHNITERWRSTAYRLIITGKISKSLKYQLPMPAGQAIKLRSDIKQRYLWYYAAKHDCY